MMIATARVREAVGQRDEVDKSLQVGSASVELLIVAYTKG